MEGYITYTAGSGGSWVAWHTGKRPPVDAEPGPVGFAIAPTAEVALARADAHAIHYRPGSTT